METDLEKLQEQLGPEGGTDEEEEDYGPNEPFDPTLLEREGPSVAEQAAARAQAVARKAGAASRRLLEGVGERLEEPGPPSDNISDLFEGPDMERDNDVYIKDLVEMDEEDVFGEGGADMSDLLTVEDEDVGEGEEDNFSDILEVTKEDIMGGPNYMGLEAKKKTGLPVRRTAERGTASLTELRGTQ